MSLPGLHLRFHKDETDFPTWFSEAEGPQPHPCFVAVGNHRYKDGVEYHCEAYQFYFQNNFGIGLRRMAPTWKQLGFHKHDVEGIVVLFDLESHQPRFVYFKAHGFGQGCWRKWEECEKTAEGELIVYVAWGSHATYPTAKNVTRIFGLANDEVSEKGPTIKITGEDFCPAIHKEFDKGIVLYDTIPPISNESISGSQRMMLPLVVKKLKKHRKK